MKSTVFPRCSVLRARCIGAAIAFAASMVAVAVADTPPSPSMVPVGTRIRFHLVAPVSSDQSRTGETFGFVLLDPIVSDGRQLVAAGVTGSGTVYLAGHAGQAGHEGDLTLRIDSIPATDGRFVTFDDQRFEINGRNRKIQAGVLGFVPFAGLGAHFIRGSEVRVDASTPIETVLLHDAPLAASVSVPPPPTAPPTPTAPPSPATSISPSPTPSQS
jgi:hypothetical protein